TGLLGYGLSFRDHWRVTVSVSNAFRAPTLNDLYYPFQNYGGGSYYVGNPNLRPERSQNQEIGLHYAAADQHVDVAYFDNRIHDMIAYNSAGTGQVLQRRARAFGSLAASHGFGAWNAGAEVRYSGARPDISYATYPYTNVSLPSYQLLNLTAGYKIDKNFNLSLRVDNLFNRDYSEAYSYNTLGRTLFIGLNYQQ